MGEKILFNLFLKLIKHASPLQCYSVEVLQLGQEKIKADG
jgi:hypothetical protein